MNSLWYNIDDGCKPLELRSMSGCKIKIENPEQEHDHEHERTHPPLPMVLPADKQNYQTISFFVKITLHIKKFAIKICLWHEIILYVNPSYVGFSLI